MPSLGDRNKDHIWHACEGCGKERWVQFLKGEPVHKLCLSCCHKGAGNGQWQGGIAIRDDGYVSVLLEPDDFFYPMANDRGRVLEHRLVMAKSLGRCLWEWEVVHHKNEKRQDNRISNLEISTHSDHRRHHMKVVRAGLHNIPGVRTWAEETLKVSPK